jgi:Ni/Co efflux regulator RcnB
MSMRFFITLLAFSFLSVHAQAQTAGETAKEIGRAVFSEMERQVIREVMGRAGIPMPEARDEDDKDDRTYGERDDDDDDRGKKGKKGKKDKKNKGKGKGKQKGMPPGLAKKGELPPGLSKRDTLPPGLAKRDLPAEVTRQLPPPPAGTERVIVDNDVVLIEKGTQVVLDIIKDVIVPK